MQAPSTVEQPPTLPHAPSRSFRRAFQDLAQGWRQRPLWGHLGFQDIKQRYRRSVIGPLWITLSTAMTAVALGILYSTLFKTEVPEFLPYVAVGLIVWNFIAGCINEGTEVFITNEGLIKHLPAPLSVHIYRMVWRQSLFFAHNLLVYVVLMVVFPHPLGLATLLAIPGLMLVALNGVWVALLVGIIATRFRDIPPIISSITQLLFFMTPIVWKYDNALLANTPRAQYAELNPFLHYVAVVRDPLLGQPVEPRHWIVVGGITVVGWALALIFLRNYRSRVSYWV
ncbi:galactan export ABC transporter permease subunit Wzm/RfbD [Longimycelium tulufanense]|uniref:galactan export ABC transporter permease subunit Wzm/RfbD n=1 Tax=Longimycelium tulufanense TaxID=907463 RepID=UPI001666A01B|nr:ABC transporter permease [Longimycelium tulufanense]